MIKYQIVKYLNASIQKKKNVFSLNIVVLNKLTFML